MPADEFEVIRTLFAPLAKSPGARGLLDDAAVVPGGLVVTTDAIVEGVHFFAGDTPQLIAKKALRVNVSDLAGKGAQPAGALLTLIWPDTRPSSQIAEFAQGLGEDLAFYEMALWGGDTASTPGPLVVSITAFGEPIGAHTPARADAKVGDDVWVTGVLGDAWLGYLALRSEAPSLSSAQREAVVQRYRLPAPRTDMAALVAHCANASMDLSDGLLGDAAKLARASNVSLRLEAARLPLSAAGRAWKAETGSFGRLLDWGDDYELLFTAGVEHRDRIAAEQARFGAGATRIGTVARGEGAHVLDEQGEAIPLAAAGHVHRLGR